MTDMEATFNKANELTVGERLWKKELERLAKIANDANTQLRNLRDTCKHRLGRNSDSAVCLTCGRLYGWWCPDSPDNACHYYPDIETNGMPDRIQLVNGDIVEVPEWEEGMSYSEDWCVYCGGPDERK